MTATKTPTIDPKNTETTRLLGQIAVDTATIAIGDPANNDFGEELVKSTDNPGPVHPIYSKWAKDKDNTILTGFLVTPTIGTTESHMAADGYYPVYGTFRDERLVEVTIVTGLEWNQ